MCRMTITDFLLARIREDEDYAYAALMVSAGRWGPARVMAEAQAKRAIVEAYRRTPEAAGLAIAVAHLAAAYSDDEDYDSAWRVAA